MAIGTCRRDGCSNPRRVRRGVVEPLCEECYRAAMDKVARELAEEGRQDGRARFRRFKLKPGAGPAAKPPGGGAGGAGRRRAARPPSGQRPAGGQRSAGYARRAALHQRGAAA
jgi:hypothetical protein